MPLVSANWKVLLPVWRGLAGAGWDSLARLAAVSCCAAAGHAQTAVVRKSERKKNRLEPVKPAAALFLLGLRRGFASLGDFGIGIDRLAGVRRGLAAQNTVGEAAVGILYRGALIGVQPGANDGIAVLHLGVGEQHPLARCVGPYNAI